MSLSNPLRSQWRDLDRYRIQKLPCWSPEDPKVDYQRSLQPQRHIQVDTAADVKRGSLYFTNSATGSYGRIPITANGTAAGQVEILATSPGEYDDFAFGTDGNVWIATYPGSLNEVGRGGGQRNFTSGRMQEPTSVKFGRGSLEEENMLYIVTHGEPTTGGQLIAVNTSLI